MNVCGFNLHILHFKEHFHIPFEELIQVALDTSQVRIMGNETQGI